MTALGMLLVEGTRGILQDVLDYRRTIVVAVSFAVGVGFQSRDPFSAMVGGVWGTLLGNKLAAGAVGANAMTAVVNLIAPGACASRPS